MTERFDRDDRRLGVAIAGVGAVSFGCLGLLYTVGEPFGTLNDVTGGAIGVLAGVLAWRIRRRVAWSAGVGSAATASAVVGAGVVAIGSALVVSNATGWFLAGLVSTVGWAFVGLWLIALGLTLRGLAGPTSSIPPRFADLAVAAGVLAAFGFVAAPGVAAGLDDPAQAPAWIWAAFVGWLGTALFLVWAGWLTRLSPVVPAGPIEDAVRAAG
jgi:hypothetical protein